MAEAQQISSGPMPLIERVPVLNPAVLIFALLSFEWYTVAQPGGLSVRLPHLAVLYGLVLGLATPRIMITGAGFIRRWAFLTLPYLLYMMILYVVLVSTEARGMAIRQIFFFTNFLVIGAWVAGAQDVRRLIWWAGLACLIAFSAGTEMIARSLGTGWVEAVTRFLFQGDLNFVFYEFFRGIFNVGVEAGESLVKASQKNSVAVALLTALLVLRAGGRAGVFGIAVTGLTLFVLLMLNSRSVLLAAVLGLGLVGLLRSLRDWRPSLTGAILLVLLFVSAAFALTMLLYTDNPAINVIEARFAFEDDSAASRMDQYGWAMQRIDSHLLWGAGYDELDGQPVHNLLLGALMHAGLPAFLLVLVAYTSLLAYWLGFMFRIVRQPGWWVLPVRPEWVAALPLIAIIRVWLSGDAGHPGLAEWTSLGVFFGLMQANAMRRSRDGVAPDHAALVPAQ